MRLGTSFLLCLRTKFRVNPKALITKDKRETFYPASLMTEGIVISLEILLFFLKKSIIPPCGGILVIEMGDRGSKSVIYVCILTT